MNRIPIIAGNWKMNLDITGAVTLATTLQKNLDTQATMLPPCEIIVAPPSLAVHAVLTALAAIGQTPAAVRHAPHIQCAVQDVHWEDNGAFTGKISAQMLQAAAIPYALVGHSEQRQYFHETNETVRRKTAKLLTAGIRPLVCIGETLAEREAGQLGAVLKTQLQEGLARLSADDLARIVIAYEPRWAIGTSVSAGVADAEAAHGFIREIYTALSSAEVAANLRILYGGSVTPANAAELLASANIDGVLVGGASLSAESFLQIIQALPAAAPRSL